MTCGRVFNEHCQYYFRLYRRHSRFYNRHFRTHRRHFRTHRRHSRDLHRHSRDLHRHSRDLHRHSAKAGIHHASGSPPSGDRHKPRHLQLAFVPALQGFANAMDSRLRGNDDGVVRHFSMYQPPRELCAIDADLDAVSGRIMKLLAEVHS